MNKPAFFLGMIVILAIALGMALRRSEGGFSSDTIVSLIAVGMMVTLMGRFVLARMQDNMTSTLRDLTIWGVLIALVALIYTNRAGLGL